MMTTFSGATIPRQGNSVLAVFANIANTVQLLP